MPTKRLCLAAFCLCLALPSGLVGAFRITDTTLLSSGADEDGDGLDDELETMLGTNPLAADTDGDGWDDYAELVQETDPCDPDDFPGSVVDGGGAPSDLLGNADLRLRIIELLRTRAAPGPAEPNPTKPAGSVSIRYYYLPGGASNLAVEMVRDDLKSGSYLLLWRHYLRWNPLGSEQRYSVAIRDDDGRDLAAWQTPSPPDVAWRYVALPFRIKAEDVGRRLTIALTPETEPDLGYGVGDFVVVPAGLEADADRDGLIAAEERPDAGRPLRHWVNDDDDRGECQERADQPGRAGEAADHAQPGVDGLRDLVDFIPLNLNLSRVMGLMTPAQGFRYFIANQDRAAQIVLTGLTPAAVGAIHRNPDLAAFGPSLDGPVAVAQVMTPDERGRIELPASFVRRIAERGHGVVLLEGARPTSRPLTVEIERGELPVGRIELPLRIAPVESMYRHQNLCGAAFEYSGRPAAMRRPARPTQAGEPTGLPDDETNGRWVVMIHGYNVAGEAARGWHAETFKRLRALGSNARFVGVTWNGDTGLDYHKAVYQAFQTGDELTRTLGFLDPSRTLLVAHSLGNVVACQAVQAGFRPGHYFLLNAALPVEAIAGSVGLPEQSAEMTEELWRPYPRHLCAGEWWRSQRINDQRAGYSWANAFSRVRGLPGATNGYSPGEDVTNCPTEMTSASVLATIWSGRPVDYGVWKTQELLKGVGWGRSLGAIAMERSQGGWGFNPAWRGRFVPHGPTTPAGGHYERMPPDEAARLTPDQLIAAPFFAPFKEDWLHQPRPARLTPLLDSPRVRYDLLARGIPALSFAAGGTAIPTKANSKTIRNFDLEAEGRHSDRWPTEGHTSRNTIGRWLHSDFKNAALPFVHPLFSRMISDGSLR